VEDLSKLNQWAKSFVAWVNDNSHVIWDALKPRVDWAKENHLISRTPLLDRCSKRERKLAYARHARWKKRQNGISAKEAAAGMAELAQMGYKTYEILTTFN
jgi:hypothetical protein